LLHRAQFDDLSETQAFEHGHDFATLDAALIHNHEARIAGKHLEPYPLILENTKAMSILFIHSVNVKID
jgi:hypothetical protein